METPSVFFSAAAINEFHLKQHRSSQTPVLYADYQPRAPEGGTASEVRLEPSETRQPQVWCRADGFVLT